MSGAWDAMNEANELQRRQQLARFTKPELISHVIGLEHSVLSGEYAANERKHVPPPISSQAGLASIRRIAVVHEYTRLTETPPPYGSDQV